MEPQPKATMTSWSCQTNWNIAAGSLSNCVTYQSSLTFLDGDADQAEAAVVDSTPKSPLVLHSPSPDYGPCEIKLNFAENHELRQVYVRSTAGVYEIYYAPNLQSNNEYLCTVRCGFAARDGEVLCTPNIQENASLHIEGSNGESGEENIKNDDDWVEVKVIDTPVLDGRNLPLQTKSYVNSAKSSQDLFEATAEISDANPCISVTLRLLSLQSKGCIYIDEIYVFGDPVVSSDSESQEGRNEISSGSSLMAMFLPTLMQFSKTRDVSHLNAVRKEKKYFSEDNLDENHPNDSAVKSQLKGKDSTTDPQEVKLTEVNEGWVGPSQPDTHSEAVKMDSSHTPVPPQTSEMESNHNFEPSLEKNHSDVPFQTAEMKCNHSAVLNHDFSSVGGIVGMALEQLVSRMDRIEEICLGFQEKMVIPMSNIEARLQQVELQLETLTNKLHNSGLPSWSRISAPDASCIESDANSFDNCLVCTVSGEIEPDNKDLPMEVSVSPGMSDSANTTHMLPCLVVTAPEFPDGEDEDNASGQEMKNSSKDEEKQTLSIDAALSSALANFLASTSTEVPTYSRCLMVKAPEFLNESDDEHTEEATDDAEKCQFCSAEGDQDEVGVKAFIAAEHNPRTAFNHKIEVDENRNIIDKKSDGLSSNISDNSNELLDYQGGQSTSTELAVATEVPKKASHEDIIESVLGFSLGSPQVDFETPLLDVKFTAQKSPVSEPFLEALLVDSTETNSLDPSVKDSHDEQLKSNGDLYVDEQCNLVSVEDGEPVAPAFVDKDYCTVPANIEGGNLQEDHKRRRDEVEGVISSLI